MMKPALLIITSDENDLNSMVRICEEGIPGIQILTASTGLIGLRLAHYYSPCVVVVEVDLPDLNGWKVCQKIKAESPNAFTPVLILSNGVNTDLLVNNITDVRPDGILLKPYGSMELILQLRSLIRWSEIETKNRNSLERLVATRTAALMEGMERLRQEAAQRREAEADRERLLQRLQRTLSEVKTLRGLLPICSNCKKIRDDHGIWNQIELYIPQHSEAQFTHGICPDCIKELYPNLFENQNSATQSARNK